MRLYWHWVRYAAIFTLGWSAWAHHSTAPYDMTVPSSVTGVVSRFYWGNPHAYIFLDVEGDQHWTIELEGLNFLRHEGWTKESLKPGDELTCKGARAKDPKQFAMKCFVAILPGQKTLMAQYLGEPPRGK